MTTSTTRTFKARVVDAGGGEVRLFWDRDQDVSYPPSGAHVTVTYDDPPATEPVPWWEAVGRIAVTPGGEEHALVVKVVHDITVSHYPWVWTDPHSPGNGCGIGFPVRNHFVDVLKEAK